MVSLLPGRQLQDGVLKVMFRASVRYPPVSLQYTNTSIKTSEIKNNILCFLSQLIIMFLFLFVSAPSGYPQEFKVADFDVSTINLTWQVDRRYVLYIPLYF